MPVDHTLAVLSMQYCICCIQDFLQKESINVTRNLNSQNLLKTYLLKEWFVMNHIKIKMGTGFIQMK